MIFVKFLATMKSTFRLSKKGNVAVALNDLAAGYAT
jgi:hypothetical protein